MTTNDWVNIVDVKIDDLCHINKTKVKTIKRYKRDLVFDWNHKLADREHKSYPRKGYEALVVYD